MRAGSLLGVTDLIGSPESVSLAREYVRQKLGDKHPALDDVILLTSEVVTNACVHSDSRDGGTVTLAIADCVDLIEVDVVDAGGETAPRVCGDLLAEGGRGLMLVEMTVFAFLRSVARSDNRAAEGFQAGRHPHPSKIKEGSCRNSGRRAGR
ncbi:ATP-binding protein [Sphaerisporangium corydalis]|uniref:ATP-binding protein n=1 Tax=Sphaerisporangium corydalis TaxID=1441875 RepID=A0ABV9EN51_9ACTN|nr:ATP-binding protein [Sphaerisporangium corydalis]